MDQFKLGEIIADMFKDNEFCKHYGLIVVKSEFDELDGSISIKLQSGKRFVIEVKEV